MTNYDVLIWICISAIVVLGFALSYNVLTFEWVSFGISVTIAIILFLVSVKISKSSMSIMFVLLKNTQRCILEKLETKKTLKQIAGELTIYAEDVISTNLAYLVKRKFILEEDENGSKTYVRNL